MDPLLFGMDGEVVAEVLGAVVLVSLLIERALSLLFEWRPPISKFHETDRKSPYSIGHLCAAVYGYKFLFSITNAEKIFSRATSRSKTPTKFNLPHVYGEQNDKV